MSPIRSRLTEDPDYAELVSEFVSNVPNRMLSIRNAMQKEDVKTLCTLIHQLRGACGSYGFHDITPLAARIEEELRLSDSIQSQMESLEEFMEMCSRMTAEPA